MAINEVIRKLEDTNKFYILQLRQIREGLKKWN